MVDQTQVLANLDHQLDRCRQVLASPDIYDLVLVRDTHERIDRLLEQRTALTHDQHA